MSKVIKSQLFYDATNEKLFVTITNRKGEEKPFVCPLNQLSSDLPTKPEQAIEVEFERDQHGYITRVRRAGTEWVSNKPIASPMPAAHNEIDVEEDNANMKREFHNPYNFVPAPPRGHLKHENDLADKTPIGHDSFYPDRFTGRLCVKMVTKTPLLLPDTARVSIDRQKHKTFDVREDLDKKPRINPTAIKGMLRSAYEAITNSRLSVFAKHDDRLAFRASVDEGLKAVPARIEKQGDSLFAVLQLGTSFMSDDGTPDKGCSMYAAWLGRYGKHKLSTIELKHKQEVWAYVTKWRHQDRNIEFNFWNVVEIVDYKSTPNAPTHHPNDSREEVSWDKARRIYANGAPLPGRWIRGYVCINNKNMMRKHDERVFFNGGEIKCLIKLDESHVEQWKRLIEDYKDADHRGMDEGIKLSRHIDDADSEKELRHGTLCYVRITDSLNGETAIELHPVMISRRLHALSPSKLLHEHCEKNNDSGEIKVHSNNLTPADDHNALSPADRVFGWVNQNKQGAYRGQVRIGGVKCKSDKAIERFSNQGLPLAILGQPKPQQGRFYVGRTVNGEAQSPRLTNENAGYNDCAKGLRGRKVYPHQNLPQAIWDDPLTFRQEPVKEKYFQEFRRPKLKDSEQRDEQNRSIRGWVKSQIKFEFDVHFTNLSKVELGGLIYLLDLKKHAAEFADEKNIGKDFYHRFGGGKPLGFGSVELNLDETQCEILSGIELAQRYRSLDSQGNLQSQNAADFIKSFKDAVEAGYGVEFNKASFINAFHNAAQGFFKKLPVHYPRAHHVDNPNNMPSNLPPLAPYADGLAYEWFVANNRTQGKQVMAGHTLPNLIDEIGLPILAVKPPRQSGGNQQVHNTNRATQRKSPTNRHQDNRRRG